MKLANTCTRNQTRELSFKSPSLTPYHDGGVFPSASKDNTCFVNNQWTIKWKRDISFSYLVYSLLNLHRKRCKELLAWNARYWGTTSKIKFTIFKIFSPWTAFCSNKRCFMWEQYTWHYHEFKNPSMNRRECNLQWLGKQQFH